MTITARVYEIIFKLLEQNPEGMQWVELAKMIKAEDSNIHPKTINGLIWKMTEKYPDKIYKPEKGRFKLIKFK